MNKLIFKKYSTDYKESILELLAFKWNKLTPSVVKEKFEWRYEQNPYSSGQTYIYLAISGAQVVGFRAFVIQHFTLGNTTYKVFNPADAIVHPNFRRMGIFSKLNEFFLTDLEGESNVLILNTSSNNLSTPGNLKQGWKVMDYINRYGFKINLLASLRNLIRLHEGKFKETVKEHRNDKITFTKELRIDEIVSLNLENRNAQTLTHHRDEAYYRWRYSFHSRDNYYAYYYVESRMVGYVIFKQTSRFQYVVQEYLSLNEKYLRLLINKSLRHFKISLLRVRAFSVKEKQILSNTGFIFEPVKLIHIIGKVRLPFLVRPQVLNPSEKDFFLNNVLDIRNSHNWSFSQSAIH